MLFQLTHICLTEPDYVTIHYVLNVMADDGAKITKNGTITVFSYQYLVPVRKGLSQTHHDRCCCLVKLLFIYFCNLELLNPS